MSELPPETTEILPNSITDLDRAESALELAWEELEKQTAEIIDRLSQSDAANVQEICDRFATAKQLRQQLKTQKKQATSRLEFHVANSPIAVVEWDSQFQVKRWSSQAEEIFGWKTAEIMGKYWHELSIVYEADLEQVNSVINKLLDGSEPRNICHNRNYTKDGAIIHCQWYNSVLKDASGKVVSILSFVRNVTDCHYTQTELPRRELAFNTLAENATDIIVQFDRELRHIYVNQAVDYVAGKAPSEFLGKTNRELGMSPDLCNLWDATCLKVFHTRQPETIEFDFATPNGIRYYHCRVIPEFAENNSVETVLAIAHDITELKQVEFQLRQSEAKFRIIGDSNIIGIIFWDIYGNILDANDFFLKTVNYTREDLLSGRINWQGMTPPEYVRLDTEKLAELTTKRTASPFEKEYIRSDGSRVPVLLGGAFLEGSQDVGVSFVLDLSETKQATSELQKNQQLLQSIVKTIPNFLYIYDLVENINIYANEACKTMLGYTPEELNKLGKEIISTLVHPEDIFKLATRIERLENSTHLDQTDDMDYRIKHKNGEWLWVHDRCTIFKKNPDGKILQIIGSVLDISDRKRAETELKELNETLEAQVAQRTAELETFFDALPDHIFVVERENMRLPFVNQSIAKMSGFDNREQMQGKTIFECYPAELAEEFARKNLQLFETGEVMRLQEQLVMPGGTAYYDTFKIPLRNLDGEVYALIGTSRDITELIETKQALSERTKQLESANQELESFSYSVSHDLRAPLRHISGFVNALKQRLEAIEALSDRKIAHYIEIIEDSSEKMNLLIDGLLVLSRVSRAELIQIPIDLTQLVQTAIKLAKLRTNTTSVQTPQAVKFEIGDLPTVIGDPTLLQQVFSNLIGNAVKFSRDRIPARIVIDSLPDGTIFVKDNGVGFEMEYANQLFGAFQRLHSQREFEGTGIGLAIVQRIIHRHNGRIWAESTPTQGATFYFRLGKKNSNDNIDL
jgi:PAS domain S-box-containing protein